ncbi:MAG TPA: DUF4235 domain-containing protein [Streptosporangiaceae bacterium]|nr:DUF4235 domain-containing protein [Streptosporangiaceae bacterium]
MAEKGDMGWRVMAAGAALVSGFVARRVITFAWKKTTGKEPPTNPESPETHLAEAIGWAVVMGVGMEVARLLATRAAARRWAKGTGELPAPLRAAAAKAEKAAKTAKAKAK